MTFNPYEILTNLRKNSAREPIRAFDIEKSHDPNISFWKNQNNTSNLSACNIADTERVYERQPFSLISNNVYDNQKPETKLASSVAKGLPSADMRNKNNGFNQEAAIKSYKDKLLQEVPELLMKGIYEQENSIVGDNKENQNSIDYDQKIGITERNLEKLQSEFTQFKQDLKKELQTFETINIDGKPHLKIQENREINNKDDKMNVNGKSHTLDVVTFKGLERKMKESGDKDNLNNKIITTNRSIKPGTLKLGPFIQLKKNFPQFPQCIIRVDLKEL